MKNFSIIKERIRQYSKRKGISIKEIYDKTGISDGTFSNKSGITEDNLLKFFNCYTDVDANLLIKGKEDFSQLTDNKNANLQDKLITMLEKEIIRLEKENSALKKQLLHSKKERKSATSDSFLVCPPSELNTK